MPRPVLPAAALLVLLAPLAAEDVPQERGVDVLPAVKQAYTWATRKPDPAKPWANDLAALTDHEPMVHAQAIRNLIMAGAKVLPDLEVIAGDLDWRIRGRVAQAAAGIGGGAAAPLVVRLSRDPDPKVREAATLALGRCSGPGVRERLEELLAASESGIREKAAQGLGALGDVRAMAALCAYPLDGDDVVKREMGQALARLAATPAGVAEAVRLFGPGGLAGEPRDALIGAVAGIGDQRLCPPLAAVAAAPGPRATAWTVFAALKALDENGDSRAWEVLARTAADHPQAEMRQAAAGSLAVLTGFNAGPGKTWLVWWADHQAEAAARARVDTALAAWHDPAATPAREQLAAFTVAELRPLLDAVLARNAERLAPWWPERAWRLIAADDPARWAAALADEAIALPTSEVRDRLALIAMIERLDDRAQAVGALRRVQADLVRRSASEAARAEKTASATPDHTAERQLLALVLDRLDPPKR
jgi:HEAT repeat protein